MGSLLSKLKKFFFGLFHGRFDYIPMKLLVEKITPEFERVVRSKANKKNKSIEVREGKEADIDSIIDLFDLAWHSTTMPYRPLSRKKIIDKVLHNPKATFLIASKDGEDVGFILADIIGYNYNIGEISALGVLPHHQREGIGLLLGIASWDYFKKHQVEVLRCKVYKDNENSKAFLNTLGFEEDHSNEPDLLHLKKVF